jgi:ubiquitin carboxyl-terminal hydrolase L3
MAEAKEKTYWTALESNPDTMNKLIKDIGVKGLRCEDIFGFDDDALAFVPQPCYAVILCFPDYKKAYVYMRGSYEELKSKDYKNPDKVFFMNQKIGNACGTFSLLHSIANVRDKVDIGNGPFAQWIEKALPLGVMERSECLEKDEQMKKAHEESARSGETDLPIGNHVEHHFITYVNIDSTLYEIDSSQEFARPIGPTTPQTMLHDTAKVIKDFMTKFESESISFNAIAVVGQ